MVVLSLLLFLAVYLHLKTKPYIVFINRMSLQTVLLKDVSLIWFYLTGNTNRGFLDEQDILIKNFEIKCIVYGQPAPGMLLKSSRPQLIWGIVSSHSNRGGEQNIHDQEKVFRHLEICKLGGGCRKVKWVECEPKWESLKIRLPCGRRVCERQTNPDLTQG